MKAYRPPNRFPTKSWANTYSISKFPVASAEQYFMPHGVLDDIITRQSIAGEMVNASNPFMTYILEKAKKLFVLAILSGLAGADL